MSGRNSKAPFEIMRRAEQQKAASGAESAPLEPEKIEQPTQVDPLPSGRARRAWWAAFDEPMVLHVPRGIVLVVCFGVLMLVAMAYWVGEKRGKTAGAAEKVAYYEGLKTKYPGLDKGKGIPEEARVLFADGKGLSSDQLTLTEYVYQKTDDIVVTEEYDCREVGLNYLIVTTASREKAIELIDFLSIHGVDAAAFPGNNSELVTVVALKGFESPNKEGSDGQRFKSSMLQLGRDWKRRNGNKGRDLSDMYFMKFQGYNR